jgi:hypothetical protein
MRDPLVLVWAVLLCGACRAPAPSEAANALPPIPAVEVTVVQRRAEPIPGTGGRLAVELGDVTGGQVLVRVTDAAGSEDVLPQGSMRVGEIASFDFDGRPRALVLRRLVNVLIGDDFAVFELTAPDRAGPVAIEAILAHIEAAPWTFVAGGAELSGPEVAGQLRRAWDRASPPIDEPGPFLDRIAGAASPLGGRCAVRLPGGREQPLATWLRGPR